MAGQNLIEKIAQRFAVGLEKNAIVHSGDFISIRPAYVLTHDNTGAVIPKFKAIGAAKIFNPRQPVFALDHDIQNRSEENLKKYKGIESFAREMGVDFYPAGRGIGHQVMCEEGYAFPGTMVVASDSHSNMYGGLGSLGTPVVRTDRVRPTSVVRADRKSYFDLTTPFRCDGQGYYYCALRFLQ